MLDAIITIDHQGRIIEFNPAAERTFGHRRVEAIGRFLADVIIPPRLRRTTAVVSLDTSRVVRRG